MFTKYLYLSAINEKPQPLPYEQLVSLRRWHSGNTSNGFGLSPSTLKAPVKILQSFIYFHNMAILALPRALNP